jgi:hypothetical protein
MCAYVKIKELIVATDHRPINDNHMWKISCKFGMTFVVCLFLLIGQCC